VEKNGFERAAAALVSHSTLSHLNGAHRQESSAPEGQQLSKGVGRPPLEAEYSGQRQETFQRIPRSNETRAGNDAENEKGDSAGSSKPSGRGNILPQHPVRLTLVLIAVALLCAVGPRFWDYLQSYEWTDDAEIEGHLDPISTRIDDTVIHVYVENTFHVSRGQALVDLDPRDYQVAVENAAANLAEAKQSVLAARQDYELSLANLNAAVATNVKAQEDVKRYRELLDQGVIARETDDAVVRNGKIAAASVNSDRAAVAAAAELIGEAQAAADAAQATLDQAKLNLSYTHIVAPASGVVGDKTVEVGERVQPGEQLLTVVPLRGASRKREEAYNDDKGTNHFLQHVWTRLSVSRSGSPGCARSDRGGGSHFPGCRACSRRYPRAERRKEGARGIRPHSGGAGGSASRC